MGEKSRVHSKAYSGKKESTKKKYSGIFSYIPERVLISFEEKPDTVKCPDRKGDKKAVGVKTYTQPDYHCREAKSAPFTGYATALE